MPQTVNTPRRAVIFANGVQADLPALAALFAPDDLLIAADGGLRYLDALHLRPHILIGDLDSVDHSRIASLTADGVQVVQYPTHKDETDLELALETALSAGCETLVIAGALGGRLDMTLANIFMLQRLGPAFDVRLDDGLEEVFLIRGSAHAAPRAVNGQTGDRLSLLALGGPAHGIVTRGLAYALRGETLFPERARGVSNQLEAPSASISLREGTLICIHTRQPGGDKEE